MGLLDSILKLISSLFSKGEDNVVADNTPKMLMTEANFTVMTAGESDENKAWLRKQMGIKDAEGLEEYTLSTDRAMYLIRRPISNGTDYTSMYGTQFIVTHKGK